jgi:protein SCO1/2
VVAVLSGSVALGIVAARATSGGGTTAGAPEATAHAPGLRAGPLPPALDGAPAPAIRLHDGRGGTVDTRAWRGRPYLVTFLYTRCPDVCPAIAQDIGAAFRRLGGAAARASAVAVSVDPRGDTPAAVRAFAARHRLPPQVAYAIGTRPQLAPVWKAWSAAPQVTGRPETSAHTAVMWLVDARGRYRGLYPAGIPVNPGEVAHDLRALLPARPA